MKKLIHSMAFLLFLSLGSILVAQPVPTAKSSPTPALVADLQPGMSWKVERLPEELRTQLFDMENKKRSSNESSQSAAGTDQKPSSMLLEENLTGLGFRQQILYIEDHRIVRYGIGKMVAIESAGGTEFDLEPSNDETLGGPLSSHRLDEFLWVGPRFFAGSSRIDGVECDIYISPWPLPSTPNHAPTSLPTRLEAIQRSDSTILAAISKNDRLPVRLEDPIQIRRYTFESTEHAQGLPVEVYSALERQGAAIRAEIRKFQLLQ